MAVRIRTLVVGTSSSPIVVADYNSLPSPSTVPGQFYWCSAGVGASWRPTWLGGTYYNAGMYYSNGTTWEFTPIPYNADQATVDAGTNDDQFLTPKTFNDSSQLSGKADLSGATFTGNISASNLANTNTGDETQSSILSKLGFFKYQINTESVTVNTVVETIVGNILIPANSYTSSGGKFEFNMFAIKTSTVGQITFKAYVSQVSNNIGSATRIATTGALTLSARYTPFRRKMNFDGTNLTGLSFSSGAVTDDVTNTGIQGSLPFDNTVDNYLIFTITLASLSDNAYLKLAEIKNF